MRNTSMAKSLPTILIGLFFGLAVTGAAENPPYAPPQPEAMKRWQDMRFGMFIHWGPVSITGHEIGWARGTQTPIEEYDNLYKKFNPVNFNADEWVKVAKDAGMKYMVLTTKHHDGFCLWDTKQTDYNIMNSPFKRDVVKELSEACKKQGIAFGTYYSTCDWYHPDFPLTSPGGKTKREKSDLDSYNRYLLAQIRELITNYGPLLTIWNDVPQMFKGRGTNTINMVRALQPDILINNRTGDGGDYDTPEQRVGGFQMNRPWETCMTICRQWAWKPDDTMKTLKECMQTLIRTAGGDGNLLFNVGPMPDGKIEQRQIDRLKEMGQWLQKYGASIYGTRGGPFKPAAWGVSTRKDKQIFVHVFNWPEEGKLELPSIPSRILSAKALTGGSVEFKQDDKGISLNVPAASREEIDTLIALEIDGPAIDIAPVVAGSSSLSLAFGAKATASNVYQKNPSYSPDKALDDDDGTRWATDAGTKQAWLEVDLGKPKEFSKVLIKEWVDAKGSRSNSFELQYKAGDEWKTIIKGGKIGKNFKKSFPVVTAQMVRLNILEATNGPTIEEFQLMK
ncbi:MAG: alpha-L-fucosidase [Kiritimatiellae bacterium]|nr:alpha-L-fucosidase [Kiritimatiellia bacterium]MDD5522982.1 alpha-L-fucosidase [Kiritimatiellia bacterium]